MFVSNREIWDFDVVPIYGKNPGLGIYKRKKENMHASSKKELAQENTLSTKKASKKVFLFFLIVFLDAFLVESVFSWASSFFRGRVRVFLDKCVFSCFLFFSLMNSQPWVLVVTNNNKLKDKYRQYRSHFWSTTTFSNSCRYLWAWRVNFFALCKRFLLKRKSKKKKIWR